MRWHDGGLKTAKDIMEMENDGYVLEISMHSMLTNSGMHDFYPPDIGVMPESNGWEIRKAMKQWCKKHGYNDFKIYYNRSFIKEIHGNRVYELYIKK